jgi:hypothetical protein
LPWTNSLTRKEANARMASIRLGDHRSGIKLKISQSLAISRASGLPGVARRFRVIQ